MSPVIIPVEANISLVVNVLNSLFGFESDVCVEEAPLPHKDFLKHFSFPVSIWKIDPDQDQNRS